MTLSIKLTDSGRHPVTLEVASWEDVAAALAPFRATYTKALITLNGRKVGTASRRVGKTNWTVRKTYTVRENAAGDWCVFKGTRCLSMWNYKQTAEAEAEKLLSGASDA